MQTTRRSTFWLYKRETKLVQTSKIKSSSSRFLNIQSVRNLSSPRWRFIRPVFLTTPKTWTGIFLPYTATVKVPCTLLLGWSFGIMLVRMVYLPIRRSRGLGCVIDFSVKTRSQRLKPPFKLCLNALLVRSLSPSRCRVFKSSWNF